MFGWFQRFMMGRYGTDQLSFTMMIAGLAISLLSRFLWYWPLYILSMVLFGVALFRMLSRNCSRRYEENRKFMNMVWAVRDWWRGLKADFQERRTYRHFKCPKCSQKIRIPKGRGKIEIRCPKCGEAFVKKT